MRKKLTLVLTCILLSTNIAFANFKEHYDLGQKYLSGSQYSSAIDEFKKALRINYLDNSARIGLVNAYLARGTYYANSEKNYKMAANDFRTALFYLKYYPDNQNVTNSQEVIATTVNNLNQCYKVIGFDTSAQSRYDKANQLKLSGDFAAAGFEYIKTAETGSKVKDAYSQAGDMMKILGNEPKSAEYYRKAIAADGNDSMLRLKYARTMENLGQEKVATEEYNHALASSSGNTEVLYALERIWVKKLESNPNNADVLANLGAVKQKQGQYDAALAYYSRSEKINPRNINTRLNVGTLFQSQKNYDKALSAYDSILDLEPNHVLANLYKAQVLNAMGESQKAKNLFNKVLTIEPANVIAKNELLNMMQSNMTPAQLLAHLSKDALTNKSSSDAIYNKALEFHKKGDYANAIAFYSESLKYNPNDADIYTNLAIVYNAQKNYDKAEEILKQGKFRCAGNKAIAEALESVKNEKLSSIYKQASEAFEKKDYSNALALYQQVQPMTSDSYLGVAACYQNLGNRPMAIDAYKKAFNLNQKNGQISYYIASLYSEEKNWEQAKIYAQKALALMPNDGQVKELNQAVVEQINFDLLTNAIKDYEAQKFPEALTSLNKLISLDNQNVYAYYYRGLIYDSQNKKLMAIEDYKKALAHDKENSQDLNVLNYMLGVAYDTIGQYKFATDYYAKFIAKTTENNEYKQYAESRINEINKQ